MIALGIFFGLSFIAMALDDGLRRIADAIKEKQSDD